MNSEISKVREAIDTVVVVLTDKVSTRPDGLSAEHAVAKPHWASMPALPCAVVVTWVAAGKA